MLPILSLLFCSCQVHTPREQPLIQAPRSYSQTPHGQKYETRWWREFNSDTLDQLVDTSLSSNPRLDEAWARLAKADAASRVAGALKYPTLTGRAGVSQTRTEDTSSENYAVGALLSYEVDLFGRTDAESKATLFDLAASEEALNATMLSLVGEVVEQWLIFVEQTQLKFLIESQVVVSKTLLDLVELRFSLGKASALDVYQQRQQLASTESGIPDVEARLRKADHALDILTGNAPDQQIIQESKLPKLPPFPDLGSPWELLQMRPDLKQISHKIFAEDERLYAAIADRYPTLDLSLDYSFSASELADLLDSSLLRIAADIVAPLIDGGRRRAEVDRREAILNEQIAKLSNAFLVALKEIEDATTEEKYKLRKVEQIDHQITIARANLSEARSRYLNGLSDYLPVITAVQTMQRLERERITEEKALLATRARLYRALGGNWMQQRA